MYFCIWSSCADNTLVTVTWCLPLLSLLLPFPSSSPSLYCLLLLLRTPPIHSLFTSPHFNFYSSVPFLSPSVLLASLPSSFHSLSHSSLPSPFPLPSPLHSPPLPPLIPSLPAHLDLSGSSTGDDLSLLPFCKEPALPSEGEGLSLDHMSMSEGSGRDSEEESRKGNSEIRE